MRKIKYVIFILIFFILGILTANIIGKDNNYSENFKYKNISINKDKNLDQDNLKLYLNNLENIPKGLLENCNNIYFSSENLNDKFDLNIKTKIVAISYGKDIYIDTNYYKDDVLIHEMYHVFDYSNNWISETEEFLILYEKYKDDFKVSPGNNENSYEFFATYGENFTLNKELDNSSDIYNFFKELNIQP